LVPSSVHPRGSERRRGDRPRIPSGRALGHRDGGQQPACGDAGQVPGVDLLVRRLEKQPGGQGYGQQRCAQGGAAGLLADDAQFDQAEARAAEAFGHGQAVHSDLGGQPGQQLVLPGGRHLGPADDHLGAGGVVQQPPDDLAQLLVLRVEPKLHRASCRSARETRAYDLIV
jgi:hypothetical protein